MAALVATVGTGNIAGVATAIAIGGPGALFWMWMTALVGMATKYAEVLLSVHFRETDEHGEQMGGPMFAIKNGLGRRWAWLGAAFALFGGLAGFGIGNMVHVQHYRRCAHLQLWHLALGIGQGVDGTERLCAAGWGQAYWRGG